MVHPEIRMLNYRSSTSVVPLAPSERLRHWMVDEWYGFAVVRYIYEGCSKLI